MTKHVVKMHISCPGHNFRVSCTSADFSMIIGMGKYSVTLMYLDLSWRDGWLGL